MHPQAAPLFQAGSTSLSRPLPTNSPFLILPAKPLPCLTWLQLPSPRSYS